MHADVFKSRYLLPLTEKLGSVVDLADDSLIPNRLLRKLPGYVEGGDNVSSLVWVPKLASFCGRPPLHPYDVGEAVGLWFYLGLNENVANERVAATVDPLLSLRAPKDKVEERRKANRRILDELTILEGVVMHYVGAFNCALKSEGIPDGLVDAYSEAKRVLTTVEKRGTVIGRGVIENRTVGIALPRSDLHLRNFGRLLSKECTLEGHDSAGKLIPSIIRSSRVRAMGELRAHPQINDAINEVFSFMN